MQKRSSKNTSINTTRLPAVYKRVSWSRYALLPNEYHIIDIGCGKLTTQQLIKEYLLTHGLFRFYANDPNHESISASHVMDHYLTDSKVRKVVVCSNVLNVIDDDTALSELIQKLCDAIVVQLDDGTYRMNSCYITVYEGDKSGIGRETKKDCWQRNEQLIFYLSRFNDYIKQKYNHNANFFKIKYGMIIGATQYGGHITYET